MKDRDVSELIYCIYVKYIMDHYINTKWLIQKYPLPMAW